MEGEMAYQVSKSKNRAVTVPAKGDAPGQKIGPTPAPTKKYVNPVLTERDAPPGYGNAKDLGPSSVEPGTTNTSPLADELKRVNAEGDQGDHLQDIIENGTSRNNSVDLYSKQTRDVSDESLAPAHGMKSPNLPAGQYETLPAKLGASAEPPVRKPS
jgi:hypothetical protein